MRIKNILTIGWNAVAYMGERVLYFLEHLPRVLLFTGRIFYALWRTRFRFISTLLQAEFVGFGSLFIVLLTGLFTGAVFTLQSITTLSQMGMESMVGSMVLLAVSRELAPVLTALMAAGRVGSAMASELGTMRVSEQIDAIEVMAVNPVGYLVVPRLVASALMTPLLCILFNAMAFIGCYWVAVQQMQIDEGAFLARIRLYLTLEDISHGLYKSFIFGIVIAYVGCYKGYHAHGGAKGVGLATTQTVVICSISVFILDYILTRWLLSHA